jgi:hypothetical protein
VKRNINGRGGGAVSGNHLPNPIPPGYGDTPLMPSGRPFMQRFREHARGRPGSQCPMASTAVPLSDRTAAFLVGSRSPRPPPRRSRADTAFRPGPLPRPETPRAAPAAVTAVTAVTAGVTGTGVTGAGVTAAARGPCGAGPPLFFGGIRGRCDPLGGVQLPAGTRCPYGVRHILRRSRGGDSGARRRDRGMPAGVASVRAQCGAAAGRPIR